MVILYDNYYVFALILLAFINYDHERYSNGSNWSVLEKTLKNVGFIESSIGGDLIG